MRPVKQAAAPGSGARPGAAFLFCRLPPTGRGGNYSSGRSAGSYCSRCAVPRCAAQVRITAAGKTRNYISYATTLLTEKGYSSVVLKAMGNAINKTVTIGARAPFGMGVVSCYPRGAAGGTSAACVSAACVSGAQDPTGAPSPCLSFFPNQCILPLPLPASRPPLLQPRSSSAASRGCTRCALRSQAAPLAAT